MRKNKNSIKDSYRRLLNIFEKYRNENIKCIAITSNSDSEGKTIVAKNAAMLLANNDKKTLFIDCSLSKDLKKKSINDEPKSGLVGILEAISGSHINDFELEDSIKSTQNENLSILTLGTNNLDKYSLIFKEEYLKRAVSGLKQGFDCIIIDAPSFENLAYTQIISSAADGCLFVLKGGINDVSEGKQIKDKLNTISCKMLGCILEREKKPVQIFNDKNNDFSITEHKKAQRRTLTNGNISADI